ncbi:hypothetical protein AK812_SmicGene6619 [Symbiodinium microadriaticum]|uniref:Uncharacterized protein n=1 Tax=Symbiodinium microadriaticum TaxID=2951 RepID=A0A1Q9EQL9_SYMMI|nr:hypothetical protein AK812_SmicGene6619 [Symbiodinium microadriaticum]
MTAAMRYLQGGLKGQEPCSLACSPQTEATIFLSGVPKPLLSALRRSDGLFGCELHVCIGTNTMWTRVAADTLFGSLRPAARVEDKATCQAPPPPPPPAASD